MSKKHFRIVVIIQDIFKSIVASRGTMLFFVSVYVCGFAAYSLLPPVRTTSSVPFLWIHSIHTLWGMACIVLLQRQYYSETLPLWGVLLIFFLPRLFVSPMQPWLSDDALRYLWDGYALLNGVNPYIIAPNTPEAASLRALYPELYRLLDYTSVTSIYPPLAEYIFAGSVWIGGLINAGIWQIGYYVWKVMLIISEGTGLLLMVKALERMRASGRNALERNASERDAFGRINGSYLPLFVYCFLPLPVIELAGQAHVDGLLCLPLGVICWYLSAQTEVSALPARSVFLCDFMLGACIAGLGGIKILPAIVLLPILRHVAAMPHATRSIVTLLVAFVGTASLLVFPLYSDTAVMLHFAAIARNNALYWQFNGVPYYALCYVCAGLHLSEYWLWMPFAFSSLRSGVVMFAAIMPKARNGKVFGAMLIALCCVLLFSPKVHTWYFVALLFVNILVGWKWLPVFASSSILSYAYYAVQPAREQYWVELCVWGASVLVAVWEWRRESILPHQDYH